MRIGPSKSGSIWNEFIIYWQERIEQYKLYQIYIRQKKQQGQVNGILKLNLGTNLWRFLNQSLSNVTNVHNI